jgi:diguanylate cyclase (GGDEF)-like protein
MRHRRGETLERYHPHLDSFLREILAMANEFVPSEAGAILLDDPRAKLFDKSAQQLTVIAAFGDRATGLLGRHLPTGRGFPGRVYTKGQAARGDATEEDRAFFSGMDSCTGNELRSLLGVPVVLGSATCGVLLLANRQGTGTFTEEEHTLIGIFAGYISSSIQNTIDGLRARELAQRDDLTGLHNDRYLHHRLRSEISESTRAETPLSLLFIDLDYFKTINDRFGHLEGSRTLHMVGILLENEIPREGVAARFGGDEFVVILPGMDAEQAGVVAEHLRVGIEATPFVVERAVTEAPIHVTASVGVASLHEHVPPRGDTTERANSLIRVADTAMYRAKAQGRNRVEVGKPEPTPKEE